MSHGLNWLFADGYTSVFSTLTLCHGKTNVTCVTWPKLAVCRWIYISIQYVESLSRKNYRNMCHMDKLAGCRWKYISIQYVDSLSCKNYRTVCHTALIPIFLKLLIILYSYFLSLSSTPFLL